MTFVSIVPLKIQFLFFLEKELIQPMLERMHKGGREGEKEEREKGEGRREKGEGRGEGVVVFKKKIIL